MIKIRKKSWLKIFATFMAFLPMLMIISCGSKAPDIVQAVNGDWNQNYEKGTASIDRSDDTQYILHGASTGFGADIILKDDCYNDFLDEVNIKNDQVGLVVISNHRVYTDIVKIKDDETVIDALDSSRFIFKRYMHLSLGAFINSFNIKGSTSDYMHGTRSEKNYGDFYPLYYVNRSFAQLGVSNRHLHGDEVLEFTYDNK